MANGKHLSVLILWSSFLFQDLIVTATFITSECARDEVESSKDGKANILTIISCHIQKGIEIQKQCINYFNYMEHKKQIKAFCDMSLSVLSLSVKRYSKVVLVHRL